MIQMLGQFRGQIIKVCNLEAIVDERMDSQSHDIT